MAGSPLVVAADGPQLRIGSISVPVVLPRLADPRLHIAAVILSIHVLGQVALGFRVSVPQIAAAILSCAVVEACITLISERRVVWPASAMLTGSGVALILRDVGTNVGDHWSTRNWWLFAVIAVGSLLSKYAIRWRGSHVFNPSNLGLVVAFLILGSGRIEPLDFWWGPLDVWMLVAYWSIIVGGLLITERLGLLELAGAFWVTFALAMGVLAAIGHCFLAPWSATPVCDGRFWWTVVTSPEVLVFLFFMITDPRTVPSARRARIGFGVAVGVVSSLLIAPQSTEFGAKVGLLGGLVLVCAARPLFTVVGFVIRVRLGARTSGAAVAIASIAALGAVVVAGLPARSVRVDLGVEGLPHPRQIIPVVEPSRVPTVTADPAVAVFGDDVAARAREIGIELVRALDVEALAVRSGDPALLRAVDHGSRLAEMTRLVNDGPGASPVVEYHFERMHLTVVRAGGQSGSRLAIEGSGTAIETVLGGAGATTGQPASFEATFAVRHGADGRWLVVGVWPEIMGGSDE